MFNFRDKHVKLIVASVRYSLKCIEGKVIDLNDPQHYYMDDLVATHYNYTRILAELDIVWAPKPEANKLLEQHDKANN